MRSCEVNLLLLSLISALTIECVKSVEADVDKRQLHSRSSILDHNTDNHYQNDSKSTAKEPAFDSISSDQWQVDDLDIHDSDTMKAEDFPTNDENAHKKYLDQTLIYQGCRKDRGCERKDHFNETYLRYCSRYKFETLLSSEILMSIIHDSKDECERIIGEFIQLDELINRYDQLFKKLLTRYNCHNGYSVKWNCEDCKTAYKDWLCATNLPYYMNGERVKPCISFCERVEQRCPYLHPIMKEQYGGQPLFICRDPNIPFVPEITPDIPYSEPQQCYDLCHLSNNITELMIDSLSKYDYSLCPDKSDIAAKCIAPAGSEPNTQPEPPDPSGGGAETDKFPSLNDSSRRKAKVTHVHIQKLSELREILALYMSQPKAHGFGHATIEH